MTPARLAELTTRAQASWPPQGQGLSRADGIELAEAVEQLQASLAALATLAAAAAG